MMNLNIPFLGTNVVMSIVFKVNYLSNGKETQVLLTEKEKTIFSLFKGVTLQKIDETYHDLHELPYCYFAKLDTTQDNPRENLLHSVFDEFLPLYYSDFGHFYSKRKEHETEEITVPLLDKAFNADEKPSKGGKEVS